MYIYLGTRIVIKFTKYYIFINIDTIIIYELIFPKMIKI